MNTGGIIALIKAMCNGAGGGFSPTITNPQDGDTLVYNATQGKWVNGAGGGSGSLAVHVDGDNALDKTWKEISDAFNDGALIYREYETIIDDSTSYNREYITFVGYDAESYAVGFDKSVYVTTSENGYPIKIK